ncbi:aminotransferase class V-fold PLP-dependent enzyme [bacterium]|nr:MAG: aminotransferase class V-fold PLP-dependent enzyme [bacterium]
MDKSNFPIFENYKKEFGKDLIYLDSAATTQKLDSVLQKMNEYYLNYCSNVHRGIYTISETATEEFENARAEIAKFFNVSPHQIIFTSGATDSLNIIARSCKNFDIEQIVTTELEHNSNILPFYKCKGESLNIKIAKINNDLSFSYENIAQAIYNKSTLLTITGCSNVTGEILNFEKIQNLHNPSSNIHKNILLSLDAAQLVPHILFDPEFDIENLKLFDFVSFSGHKVFGATGIGVLIINNLDLISELETNLGGGTIENLELKIENNSENLEITYKSTPERFEAGTQNIAGAIGLGEVFRQANNLTTQQKLKIRNETQNLAEYTYQELSNIPKLKLISNWDVETHAPIFTFTLNNIHPHDVAQYLNGLANICIRAGQHCTHITHKKLGLKATCRASISIYNDSYDIQTLIEGIYFMSKQF